MPDGQEKQLLGVLVAISTGVDDVSQLGVLVEMADWLRVTTSY